MFIEGAPVGADDWLQGGANTSPLIDALRLARSLITGYRGVACAINTRELVERFHSIFPDMFCGQQQDPRELLGRMMGRPEVPGTGLDTTFRFDQEVRVTCCGCGRVSTTVSSVHSMPVPMVDNIDKDGSTDLQSLATSNWASEDELDGWRCPGGCPAECIAMKALRLASRPRILHITLLRYDSNGKVRRKPTIHVVTCLGICCLVV